MNKNPTENDIIDCFIKLINEQNSTTTYDVKLEMRKKWILGIPRYNIFRY